jgi:hypothetical protein
LGACKGEPAPVWRPARGIGSLQAALFPPGLVRLEGRDVGQGSAGHDEALGGKMCVAPMVREIPGEKLYKGLMHTSPIQR